MKKLMKEKKKKMFNFDEDYEKRIELAKKGS